MIYIIYCLVYEEMHCMINTTNYIITFMAVVLPIYNECRISGMCGFLVYFDPHY